MNRPRPDPKHATAYKSAAFHSFLVCGFNPNPHEPHPTPASLSGTRPDPGPAPSPSLTMTLDLTKAPWPERKDPDCDVVLMSAESYDFARHRVNLHEELVREVEQLVRGANALPPGTLPPHLKRETERLRQLLARAKQ